MKTHENTHPSSAPQTAVVRTGIPCIDALHPIGAGTTVALESLQGRGSALQRPSSLAVRVTRTLAARGSTRIFYASVGVATAQVVSRR